MANALVQEKSPYLLQHADNPVNWLPWGEAAFSKARAEEKPIFLSIGYATCHWCHVMAHESFENPEIAALLNADFVAIKVDREERPDVDKVYMAYVQALTGHGGWPLSAWLTPELKPFFGGTYFPPEDRHGRPGFPAVLRAIARGWENERDKLVAEGERVMGTLREHRLELAKTAGRGHGGGGPGASPLAEAGSAAFEKCFQYFFEAFDAAHGGFGGAPKFPRAANLNFLFRAAAMQGIASEAGAEAVKLAATTLRAMAQGGIHDHVGGGFHRYSVDEAWFVPHFEKMLYDQAQIATNCLEARQATGDERFAWLARDIFDYVRRDLTSPDGGFYSAEDADSAIPAEDGRNGEESETREDPAPSGAAAKAPGAAKGGGPAARHAEGAFYVWTQAGLAAVLGAEAPLFAAHFGVAEAGNVPERLDPAREFAGKNILAQRQPLATTAAAYGLTTEQANARILAALEKLRAVRARRPRPLRDDKIITAWNGLMISALAKAHQVLGSAAAGPEDENGKEERGRYLAAATRAAEFVRRELYDAKRGVLFRSWRGGRGTAEGFAEDYAFFIQGLLDLYEASFEIRWLQWAERLQETMDTLFLDAETGGYFNSAAGDPHLVLRLKEDYDGAEPAASSVAAMNGLRLAAVFDDGGGARGAAGTRPPLHRDRGRACIEAFRAQWSGAPQALPQLLCALELALDAPRHVVLAGDPRAEDFRALVAVLHETPGPRRALLGADGGEGQRWLAERAPWLAEMKPVEGRATAYVCEEFACQAPVTAPAELRRLLNGG
jgi:uncharacterized protein YyaL (SSP411 family)